MATTEVQKKIIEAVEKIVDKKVSTTNSVNNKIGVVSMEPNGYDCFVKMDDVEYQCVLPEHLQTWIQKGDIVIVQDLYGNGQKYTVTGKTGSTMQSPSLVFSTADGKNISGRDGIFNNNEKLDTAGTVSIGG